MNTKNFNVGWFILLAALWGGSYVAIKVMVIALPPFFSAFLRVGLALFFLTIIFRVMRKDTQVPANLRWRIWLIGIFPMGIPFIFLFWGEQFISPGLAGILCASVPIWAFILSLLFLSKTTSFSAKKLLGLFLGILGVAIIFWPMLAFSGKKPEIIGSIAALIMAVSYAIGALLNQHLLAGKKVSFHANIYHQTFSSMMLLLIVSLLFEKWPHWHTLIGSPKIWFATLYLALFSTALAWLMYFHLIREWGAVRASSVVQNV